MHLHPESEGVGVEEVVVGHPEPEEVGGGHLHPEEVVVGHPEPEGVGVHHPPEGEVVVGHLHLEVVGVPGHPQVEGHLFLIYQDCTKILNTIIIVMLCLLLETQFTFFIALVPAPGYCMQII